MTGYTHTAFDKKMGLREFALLCARAMGFTITMRDEDFNAPLPAKFVPDTYHAKKISEAEKAHSEWWAMTAQERQEWAHQAKAQKIVAAESYLAQTQERVDYLTVLEAEIRTWQIPQELESMRTFMLNQVTESIRYEFLESAQRSVEEAKAANPDNIVTQHGETLERDLGYYKQCWFEEQQRVAERNRYLQMLRDSLSQEAQP